MAINSDQITGFAVGIGAAALGVYLYKKNRQQVDQWLRQQGINVPDSGTPDPSSLSLEDLVREKERLEDLIAEREVQRKAPNVAPASRASE
jgi:hypothetical protein